MSRYHPPPPPPPEDPPLLDPLLDPLEPPLELPEPLDDGEGTLAAMPTAAAVHEPLAPPPPDRPPPKPVQCDGEDADEDGAVSRKSVCDDDEGSLGR